jgi:spermidine synthase
LTWFSERLHSGYSQQIEVTKIIVKEKTPFQDLAILETARFGRMLVLDGVVQTTEKDEFIYHEMLAHVPLFAHGTPRDVLIIGGGDGGLLREVLRHDVGRCVLVEIDGKVIELCRRHLPALSAGAFDDRRAEVIVGDGVDYVRQSRESFDAILVDSTDPAGPGSVLFTETFYADCRRLLTKGGILAAQNGVPFLQGQEVATSWSRLRPNFADVGFFFAAVPTYIGGVMALTWASDDPALRRQPVDIIAARIKAAALPMRYYTAEVHVAAFAVPAYVGELMRAHAAVP